MGSVKGEMRWLVLMGTSSVSYVWIAIVASGLVLLTLINLAQKCRRR